MRSKIISLTLFTDVTRPDLTPPSTVFVDRFLEIMRLQCVRVYRLSGQSVATIQEERTQEETLESFLDSSWSR